MPIRYRKYYIQRLNETIEQQNQQMDQKFNMNGTETLEPSKKQAPPLPIPDFATKTRAPKK